MFSKVSHKVAIRNFKLARPRQLPTCPNGHGTLVPAHALFGCIDCGHTQPRTPSTRPAPPAEATDLAHHLRQADAPEEKNEKGNNGPAGDSGGRGRAISGGADNPSTDEMIAQDEAEARLAYRNGRLWTIWS